MLGATVPFWLVGAPLLDLAWLRRRHWFPLMDVRRWTRLGGAAPAAMRVRSSRLRGSRRRMAAAGNVDQILRASAIDRRANRP